MTGKLVAAADLTASKLNIGNAIGTPGPTTVADGDIWITNQNKLAWRTNGVTINAAGLSQTNAFNQPQTFLSTSNAAPVTTITNTGTREAAVFVAQGTSPAVRITQTGTGESFRVEDETSPDSTAFVISNLGRVGVGVTPDATVALSVDTTGIKFGDGTIQTTATIAGATGATGAGATGATGIQGATGNIGSTGSTGPQGATGITGATGDAGPEGATGIQGSTGEIGSTGATGLEGATGEQGATGTTGPDGATGLQGATGETGATGEVGATGVAGIDGATGATGLQGDVGPTPWTLPATVYDNGASYNLGAAVTYQGGYYYRTGNPLNPGYPPTPGSINESWTPVADGGATGITGATGGQGATGLEGSTGLTGDQGATGEIGSTGETGSTGLTGDTGATGEVGATGLDGSTGATGVAGEVGATGATGVAGVDGATGATGIAGDVGATGATGISGVDGATGATGVGATGATGVGESGSTGATGDIGATGATGVIPSNLTVDYIEFDSTYTSGAAQYQMAWNDTDGTVELGLKGGNVNLSVGQENVILVKNDQGSALAVGDVVYISGANGENLLVKKAQADGDANSASTIGVVAETIAINGQGFITTFGVVKGVNTNAFNDGDILYLSPTTAGAFTNVKPSAPQHLVLVGFVQKKSGGAGEVFVEIQNGYELQELHNVQIDPLTLANDDLLAYNSATSTWQNKAITGVIGATGAIGATGSTGATGATGVGTQGATGATGATPANIILSDTTGLTGATQLSNIVQITQAGYNLIVSPSVNTLYVIVG
jgi:hypothetical protein